MSAGVVIVGGGLGAVRTVQALSDRGIEQPITLLTAETILPYDRPPLTKRYLLGEASEEDLILESAEHLAEMGANVRMGARAVGLDLAQKTVLVNDGEKVAYDQLVIATGARPNRLELFNEFENVIYLNDLATARQLRAELDPGARVGIVGGGFIGLEIAAAATRLGAAATVVEVQSTPLARVIGTELGGWIRAWHEEHGVQFRCGAKVIAADSAEHGPYELQLSGGDTLTVDIVVVGVGVTPDVAWMSAAGLATHHGLVRDAQGRTSDPQVFGVGDVACWHDQGRCKRSGHWTATGEQARRAAAAMLGGEPIQRAGLPGYFWSEQFDKRLQFAGQLPIAPSIELISGSLEDRKFVVQLCDDDRPTAVFGLDSARDFVKAGAQLR